MASTEQLFSQAETYWDLKTLYQDLAAAKTKPLTPVEKLHLRGLLCGRSPSEIAKKLNKDANGVGTDLSATVYRYVKILLDKSEDKIDNWRNVAEWLEDAGYRNYSVKIPGLDLLPEQAMVGVSNITIETNQIVILINLRIPTVSESSSMTTEIAELENP
jgi:hypothetical protein